MTDIILHIYNLLDKQGRYMTDIILNIYNLLEMDMEMLGDLPTLGVQAHTETVPSQVLRFLFLPFTAVIIIIIIIIIIIKIEQGRERVRTLYQSEDPNPTQPTHGREKKTK